MSRKQLKIYSNKEFKAADRLERIYMWMIEPDRFDHLLSDGEERYARDLQRAYQGCFRELRRSEAVRWIQANIPGAESMYKANRTLDDMQQLFGRFLDKNLVLQKQLVIERMYEKYEAIRKVADQKMADGLHDAATDHYERAANILEKAAKLQGLDKIENTGFDPSEFQIPPVEISNDPKVLRQGDAEDIEGEPVTDQ